MSKLVPLENKMKEARKALKQLVKSAIIGDVTSPINKEWKGMK